MAFLITSFVFYWWHVTLHRSDFLWRNIHQLHHSSQRIKSITAFFAHPLDSAFATMLGCFGAYFILGASPVAAAWSVLFTGLYNFYIHSDTKSPYWLGYFIQRPEMHRIHHRRNYPKNNYGFPLWDLLFGTFENPKQYVEQTGFNDAHVNRMCDMLKGVDVYKKSSNA